MALLFPPSSSPTSPHRSTSHIYRNTPFTTNPNLSPSLTNPRTYPSLTLTKFPTIPTEFALKKTLILANATPPPSSSSTTVTETTDLDFTSLDLDEEDVAGSPWEGALVYRRDASVSHLEYCTTLERLGLGKLSTDTSRSRASAMGIRMTARRGGAAKDPPLGDGTPVLISLDVTRRKRRLKLDGIVRTVITLGCNRCAEPAAECVFSNFTILLTEDPIEEPDEINMGVIFGQDKPNTYTGSSNEQEEEDDEKLIDMEDRLYFPAEDKEIDISKHIRDIVHVEITINGVCDASCKGLCLKCGTNLNKNSCNCSKEEVQNDKYGPLKDLRKQMQQR